MHEAQLLQEFLKNMFQPLNLKLSTKYVSIIDLVGENLQKIEWAGSGGTCFSKVSESGWVSVERG